ncbi:hypothetical protein COLO4_29948 [Corchorus olitorius]|uniref:Uncharacterized protein n=1 Tax=Corchorus olitorius TaxID=93759 RepID=A0A1R3HCE8_9ROSI|nr:hypothetical protein COLO4_29948 [Corchorus olitorius]
METKPSAKGVAEGACTNLKCLHLGLLTWHAEVGWGNWESLLQPIRDCQIDVLEMHGVCKMLMWKC